MPVSLPALISGSLLAFLTTWVLSLGFTHFILFPHLLDYPNARSLHGRPVPRMGGLALSAGILVGMAWSAGTVASPPHHLLAVLLTGWAPLAMVSFLDDRRGVVAKWRILMHLFAAVSLLVANLAPRWLDLPGFIAPLTAGVAIPLTLLFGVWMINLYNFMDGMDGFAGGMAVIGFSTLAWLGRADVGFTAFCLTVAAASAGFLVHNFPPARLFLGDTGSTTLGFLAAACSLWGAQTELFPFWIAMLVFSPFSVDASVTLLRRLLRGENVWEAHRTHYYQRLVLLGWGHRRTVLAEYTLMLACAGSALLAAPAPPAGQAALALGWVVIYILLMRGVGRLEQRRATAATPRQTSIP